MRSELATGGGTAALRPDDLYAVPFPSFFLLCAALLCADNRLFEFRL
jgi:hypothetical protein